LIRTDWTYVAAKTLTAAVLLSLLQVPYVPVITVYLYAHEQITTWLRSQLAGGRTSYKPAYLFMILATVGFWTALACWLWQTPGFLGRTSATGILLSTAMLGAMRGYRDRTFLISTCVIPLGTLLVLTLGNVEQLNDPRDFVMAGSPLVLGFIGLCRSVVGLRHRDRVVQQATAERDLLFAKLEQARSHLEQVTDLSGVAGWDVELPSRSCKLSPAAVKMLGLASEPGSLEAFLSNFTPESGAAFQVALRNARRFGRTVDVDAQMSSQGDAPRWIRLVGTVVDDQQGTSRFVGAMQDLSERIATLGRARQEEVDNALARLSSRAAAEFKKDLNDVSRSLAELGKRSSTGTLEHMLQQGMRLSLNRALDTAQSLQAFGASNPIEPGLVSLQKCISDVVIASSRLLPSNIALTVHAGSVEHMAMLDPAELELSLLHLILNARDSMENGGELTITCGVDDHRMPLIEIRDTGVGIRPEVQARLFEPFFTTKRAAGARGLGLSIVRGFVEQARGRLDVKSEPGAGSTFRMVFPAAANLEKSSGNARVTHREIRGTILLAHEDETILQELGPALLEEGLILHYARSARDCMSMLEGKVRYDGVVLSNAQCRSLPGQALIARLPRQWPQTQIACLADLAEQQTLPSAGVLTCILSTEPASSIARQISSQIRDDSLDSTRPA
jgi:signal transduction histidine kinase